jgi:hypothetical protein
MIDPYRVFPPGMVLKELPQWGENTAHSASRNREGTAKGPATLQGSADPARPFPQRNVTNTRLRLRFGSAMESDCRAACHGISTTGAKAVVPSVTDRSLERPRGPQARQVRGSNSRSSCPICQKSCYSRDRFPFIGLTAVSFSPKGGLARCWPPYPALGSVWQFNISSWTERFSLARADRPRHRRAQWLHKQDADQPRQVLQEESISGRGRTKP